MVLLEPRRSITPPNAVTPSLTDITRQRCKSNWKVGRIVVFFMEEVQQLVYQTAFAVHGSVPGVLNTLEKQMLRVHNIYGTCHFAAATYLSANRVVDGVQRDRELLS